MVSRAGSEVLVESDFLFGLRGSDRHHSQVMKALEMHRRGAISISILSSSVMEVWAVLLSRGLRTAAVEDSLALIDAILAENDVHRFVPVEMSDAALAERLRGDRKGLGFFDSLHAAVSRRLGINLLSSEGAYENMGLKVMDLDSL